MFADTPALTEAQLYEIERTLHRVLHDGTPEAVLAEILFDDAGAWLSALLAAARRGLRADALADAAEDHLFRGRSPLKLNDALVAYRSSPSASPTRKWPTTEELAAQITELRRAIFQIAKANDELTLDKMTTTMWGSVNADIAEHLREQET